MNLLEKADFYFQNQLPFVLFAKPNEDILQGVFQNDATLHTFENQIGFVFASFYKETNVVFPLPLEALSKIRFSDSNMTLEFHKLSVECSISESGFGRTLLNSICIISLVLT